jgi:cyclopropane fatty-acyl-phospholipid synthase-like methyltransferase
VALYGEDYFRGSGNADYGFDDYYALRAAVERTAGRRLRKVRTHLGLEGGVLLDVGCGPGFFLNVARANGWDTQGLEISDAASHFARETLRLPVTTMSIDAAALAAEQFDLVTMWDVLEHVADPARALNTVRAALRPGGGLVLTTGDVESAVARASGERWHLYNFPEHFFFHTERSLRGIAEQAGLRVVAVHRDAMIVSLSYAIERVARSCLGGFGRGLGRKLPEVLFPATLHDVMTVYAVRPA